jgi:hypothetical protein
LKFMNINLFHFFLVEPEKAIRYKMPDI